MRRSFVALALVVLAGDRAFAVSEGAPAALYPLLTPNARASAMGQSYVAVADDATAAYWNPAGLAYRHTPSVSFFYAQLVPDLAPDIRYYHFAYARPGWGGTLGLSVIFLSFGESNIILETGEERGTFSSFDFVPMISYGNQITDRLALGAGFKFIYSKLSDPIPELNIGDGAGKSIAGDLSILYTVTQEQSAIGALRLGAILQNLGPNIAYNDEDQAESLFRLLRAGFSWTPNLTGSRSESGIQLHKILVTGEVTKPLVNADDIPIWMGGAEYTFYELVSLRGGWIQDTDGDITDATYGIGFSLRKTAKIGLRFDYASVPQSTDLDRVNRFALSYDW